MPEELSNRDAVDRAYTDAVAALVEGGARPSEAAEQAYDQLVKAWQEWSGGAPVPRYIETLGEETEGDLD